VGEEAVLHGVGESYVGIDEKRGDVVLDGAFAGALEVDDGWCGCAGGLMVDHDVAGLKVPVHEAGEGIIEGIVGDVVEGCLIQAQVFAHAEVSVYEGIHEVVALHGEDHLFVVGGRLPAPGVIESLDAFLGEADKGVQDTLV